MISPAAALGSFVKRFRRQPVLGAIAVFIVALGARLVYLYRIMQGTYGIRTPPDTQTFLRACDVLATDPMAVSSQTKGLQYLGFTAPFCTVMKLTGESLLAWVLAQILVASLAAVLVYYTMVRLQGVLAGLVAGFAYAVLFDTFRFTVFALSETTFTVALVVGIWVLTRYVEAPTRRRRLAVFVALGWIAITRPFGAPIVGVWLLLDALPADSDYRIGLLPRPASVLAAVTAPVAALLFSSLPRKLTQIERSFREGWVLYKGKADFFLAEYVYTPRPSSGFIDFLVSNFDHVIVMSVLRVIVLYIPLIAGEGSPFWKTITAVTLTPLVIGALVGGYRAIRHAPQVFALLAVPIIVVTGAVAVTFVSLSWRYRAPLGPALALLTGYAVATSTRVCRIKKCVTVE